MDQETKVCIKCGKDHPISNYYKHPANKTGISNTCKDCVKIYQDKYYEKKAQRKPDPWFIFDVCPR